MASAMGEVGSSPQLSPSLAPLDAPPNTQPVVANSMTCSACNLPMTGQFVKALGTVYHLDCFRCGDCQVIVANKFFPVEATDGKQHPLCETDYFRRLGLICAKCGLALRGSYITACNKKFHVEHFTCTLCSTLFGPSDSYYEHSNNVYCHYHYSTRFATKCIGCNSAILKQFVEIKRNKREECWHPECYMIHKFWNVKVRPSPLPPPSDDDDAAPSEPSPVQQSFIDEESTETPVSLKDKQTKMEAKVYRIWTVLSAFEESSASCISEMLRSVSASHYLDAIRMAERFILHVECLFGCIDDLEIVFASRNVKGMSHVREARMLCRKTVDLFTLLSRSSSQQAASATVPNPSSQAQQSQAQRVGMTQELLALVTGLAHYLKILIRIALTGGLKLGKERHPEYSTIAPDMRSVADEGVDDDSGLERMLYKLEMLVRRGGVGVKRFSDGQPQNSPDNRRIHPSPQSGTAGVLYGYRSLAPELAGDSPFWAAQPVVASQSLVPAAPNPPSDLCMACNQTVEEDCVRLGTYKRWHSGCVKCSDPRCGKVAAVSIPSPPSTGTASTSESKDKDGKDTVPAKVSTARRPPANVDDFVYDEKTPPPATTSAQSSSTSSRPPPTIITIYCTAHAPTYCNPGFEAVSRLEQYAFLLNVALRRLYVLLRQRNVIAPGSDSKRPITPSASSSTFASNMAESLGIGAPQSAGNRSPVTMGHLDRKLSYTSRVPQRSTVVESPSGRTAVAGGPNMTFEPKQRNGPTQPSRPVVAQGQSRQAVPVRQNSSDLPQSQYSPASSPPQPSPVYDQMALRPDFNRENTRLRIVDDIPSPLALSNPTSPTPPFSVGTGTDESTLSRLSDDTLTLADIPHIMEAEQRSISMSTPNFHNSRPLLADLSALELSIVKHCAVWALRNSPLREHFELDEILELVEMKKSGFWKQLFKGSGEKNKGVKKKGVFGVPLELLVERDGFDSTLGVSRTPLRVPSFLDDLISAMRQMDMSVEGVFRKSGNIRRLKELSDLIDKDAGSIDLTGDTPVQLAALMKKFLRELPDPLFTFKLHKLFVMSLTLQSDRDSVRWLHLVSLLLPKCNQDTVQVLFVFLKWVASFAHVDESGNKMDLQNLSTVLAPNVLYSKGRDVAREETFSCIRVITDFLEHQDELYTVPQEFMDVLRDKEFFSGALELPGKEFLKKIDSYMKMKAGGRGHPGMFSPVGNGSHSPFHPQGPVFSNAGGSGMSTPRDDRDVRLVPQRSDPALSRGRTIANDGRGNLSPRRQRPDSRSLERSDEPQTGYATPRHQGGPLPAGPGGNGGKLAVQHPGLPHQSISHPVYPTSSLLDPANGRPRPVDTERSNAPYDTPTRLSGECSAYSPVSEGGPPQVSRHRM